MSKSNLPVVSLSKEVSRIICTKTLLISLQSMKLNVRKGQFKECLIKSHINFMKRLTLLAERNSFSILSMEVDSPVNNLNNLIVNGNKTMQQLLFMKLNNFRIKRRSSSTNFTSRLMIVLKKKCASMTWNMD